jgi:hypothetical protein
MAVAVLTVLLYVALAAAGFVLVIAVCAIFLGLLHVILPGPADPSEPESAADPTEVDAPADT